MSPGKHQLNFIRFNAWVKTPDLSDVSFLHVEHKGQRWHNDPALAHLDPSVPIWFRHLLPGTLLSLHLFTPAALPQVHFVQPSSCIVLFTAGAVPQPGWECRICCDNNIPGGWQGWGQDQEGCGSDSQSASWGDQQFLDDGGFSGLPAWGLRGCSLTQRHFHF